MKIDKKDVDKISAWRYLSPKEIDRLCKKYEIVTYEKLRELQREAIRYNTNLSD